MNENKINHNGSSNIRRGLIIGRYQMFHNGHLNTLKFMDKQRDIDEIILGIGSSQYDRNNKNWEMPWITNPFTYEEREGMVKEALEGHLKKPLIVVPIQDQHNIVRWTDYVIHKLPKFDIYFSNTGSEIEHFSRRGYPIRNLPITGSFHAQKIREMIALGEDWKAYVPKGTYDYIMRINGEDILSKLFQDHAEEIIDAHNFFPDLEWRTFEKISVVDKNKILSQPLASSSEYIDDYFIDRERRDINIKFRSGVLKVKNDLEYMDGLEKTATYSYKLPLKSSALNKVFDEIGIARIDDCGYANEEAILKHFNSLGFMKVSVSKKREVRFYDACAIDIQNIHLLEDGLQKGSLVETIGLESRSRNKLLGCIRNFGLEKYAPQRYTDYISKYNV